MAADEFVAHWSRRRLAALMACAALFVLGGLWLAGMVGEPPVSDHYPQQFQTLMGWVSVVFFGFCLAALVKRWFEREEQVRIGRSGIRLARLAGRTILWSEITDVTTWSYKRQRMIVVRLRDPTRFRSDLPFAGALAGINKALSAGDIQISLTGTDRSFDEAMEAIRRFRR